MTLNDPIADMLTRIRNAILADHSQVAIPNSNVKAAIANILVEEGFIDRFEVHEDEGGKKTLVVSLKYVGKRRDRRPVITDLERVSVPGQRIYAGKDEIPYVLSGVGISIITTSQGVMTGRQAREKGIGGEILCNVG